MHRPRVQDIDRTDDASREPVICAEGHLQVAREGQARIENAHLRRGPRSGGAGDRLVQGVKRRHPPAVAAQKRTVRAVVPIGASDPRVRWVTTEQADAAPDERAPLAPQIVIESEPRRPEQSAARQHAGVDAQCGFERGVRGHGVGQEGYVDPQAGGQSQGVGRAPAILCVQADLTRVERDAARA